MPIQIVEFCANIRVFRKIKFVIILPLSTSLVLFLKHFYHVCLSHIVFQMKLRILGEIVIIDMQVHLYSVVKI